jgi:serine phosphatase RsbU (regulator of sigma subunit)
LTQGDSIYIFTDGFADQFGGPKGKKLMYKPFKELLLSIQNMSMDEQKNTLEKHFNDWKGNHEQIDDVCIIGVKLY